MPSSNETRLTFGVEIECIACVSQSSLKQMVSEYKGGRYSERQALVYFVTGLLKKVGIPVHRYEKSSGEIKPGDFSRWFIDDDRTITRSRQDYSNDREHFTLELVSRILPLDDLEYTSDAHPPVYPKPKEGIYEVVRVLKVLEDSSVSFTTNDSCGLHLHIGMKYGKEAQPFSSSTLRIFSGLVTAVEMPINSIVASHRVNNNHCLPPSKTSRLYSLDTPSRLVKIQSRAHSEDIVELMNPNHSRKHAYNFQNLLSDGNGKNLALNTIEFRQHEGTLDPSAVTAFLQVAAGLVRLAFHSSTEKRTMAWAEYAERGAFTITDLLRKLNKPHLIGYYVAKERSIFGHSECDSDYENEQYPSSCYEPSDPRHEEEPLKRGIVEALTYQKKSEGKSKQQNSRSHSPARHFQRPSGVEKVLNLLSLGKNKNEQTSQANGRHERLIIK